jgi:hypothetical protein
MDNHDPLKRFEILELYSTVAKARLYLITLEHKKRSVQISVEQHDYHQK